MFDSGMYFRSYTNLCNILSKAPDAMAVMKGGLQYPEIRGTVQLHQTACGVVVAVQVMGLPYSEEKCKGGVFGFHIHEGLHCSGNDSDPFADAGAHYNPGDCSHPYHAGDLPPLFGNKGSALSVFMTDRFRVREVIGRTIIIHAQPDDFMTQPAGNSGIKIACGKIMRG